MIDSLSPREIPWAPPSGFPSCSGYIARYIPPLVIIQIKCVFSFIFTHFEAEELLSIVDKADTTVNRPDICNNAARVKHPFRSDDVTTPTNYLFLLI